MANTLKKTTASTKAKTAKTTKTVKKTVKKDPVEVPQTPAEAVAEPTTDNKAQATLMKIQQTSTVIATEALKQVKTNVKKQANIPNLLTLFRIWAIPGIIATFFFNSVAAAWIGVILFALAGISDYMDGYLARHWNQLTRFGRVLDPIADKLLVGSLLLMLAHTGRLGDWGIIPAVVILCREILVSGLREFLAEIKVGCPVTRLAKWKTACQMVALPMLMLAEPTFNDALNYLGYIALWGAAILTVMTGYDYWKSGRKYMDQ